MGFKDSAKSVRDKYPGLETKHDHDSTILSSSDKEAGSPAPHHTFQQLVHGVVSAPDGNESDEIELVAESDCNASSDPGPEHENTTLDGRTADMPMDCDQNDFDPMTMIGKSLVAGWHTESGQGQSAYLQGFVMRWNARSRRYTCWFDNGDGKGHFLTTMTISEVVGYMVSADDRGELPPTEPNTETRLLIDCVEFVFGKNCLPPVFKTDTTVMNRQQNFWSSVRVK